MTPPGAMLPSLWAAPGGRGTWGRVTLNKRSDRRGTLRLDVAVQAWQVLRPREPRATGLVYPKEPLPGVKLLTRDQFWTNITDTFVDRAAELMCH